MTHRICQLVIISLNMGVLTVTIQRHTVNAEGVRLCYAFAVCLCYVVTVNTPILRPGGGSPRHNGWGCATSPLKT